MSGPAPFSTRDWTKVCEEDDAAEEEEAAFLATLGASLDRIVEIKKELAGLVTDKRGYPIYPTSEKALLDEWEALASDALDALEPRLCDSKFEQSVAQFCELRASCRVRLGRADKKWGLMRARGLPPGTVDQAPALALLADVEADLDRADGIACTNQDRSLLVRILRTRKQVYEVLQWDHAQSKDRLVTTMMRLAEASREADGGAVDAKYEDVVAFMVQLERRVVLDARPIRDWCSNDWLARHFRPRASQTQWYAAYWKHYRWLRQYKHLSREDWSRGRGMVASFGKAEKDDGDDDPMGEYFPDRRPMMLACCALGLANHGDTTWAREGEASEIYAEAAALLAVVNEAPYGNCGALAGLAADAALAAPAGHEAGGWQRLLWLRARLLEVKAAVEGLKAHKHADAKALDDDWVAKINVAAHRLEARSKIARVTPRVVPPPRADGAADAPFRRGFLANAKTRPRRAPHDPTAARPKPARVAKKPAPVPKPRATKAEDPTLGWGNVEELPVEDPYAAPPPKPRDTGSGGLFGARKGFLEPKSYEARVRSLSPCYEVCEICTWTEGGIVSRSQGNVVAALGGPSGHALPADVRKAARRELRPEETLAIGYADQRPRDTQLLGKCQTVPVVNPDERAAKCPWIGTDYVWESCLVLDVGPAWKVGGGSPDLNVPKHGGWIQLLAVPPDYANLPPPPGAVFQMEWKGTQIFATEQGEMIKRRVDDGVEFERKRLSAPPPPELYNMRPPPPGRV
ncbi:guanyl-nucleotide exchange factor [Aureococcus anophagefferens]|uniref:Guanyl-nucleotide exchange factor n=1 Tax=Aureococcus anophagefferens TaxID=44056 RepID=A0ABR1G785_AURAN